MPIGSYASQPIGAFAVSAIDHIVKERLRVRCYVRYCDDAVGLARTRGEAMRALRAYDSASAELGLCVKSSAIVSPIRHTTDATHKKRKRQRSHTGHSH